MKDTFIYKELSYKIIGICFKVHRELGSALPEYCYQRALELEFKKQGIPCTSQEHVDVHYDSTYVGHFIPDIIVDNSIILELKSDNGITANHISQLITYLTTTKLRVGYVVNFGVKSVQFKRLII